MEPEQSELRAIENKMRHITHSPSTAQVASKQVAGEAGPEKSTLLNGQYIRTYPELHQSMEPGSTHGVIKGLTAQWVGGGQINDGICKSFAPLETGSPGKQMQAFPDLLPLSSHPPAGHHS